MSLLPRKAERYLEREAEVLCSALDQGWGWVEATKRLWVTGGGRVEV